MKIMARLNNLSLMQHWAVGILVLAAIEFLDYATGASFRVELFYLAPILYITWFIGMEMGLFFSVSSLLISDYFVRKQLLTTSIEIWHELMDLAFFVIITVLFSKLISVNKQLERQATRDTLTGIFNRNKFNEALHLETRRALRYKTPLSLILFDVDNFKRINDHYGHAAGDHVLKDMCGVINKHVRATDYFARWGGEEFVLLVTNAGTYNALILAEKLRSAIQDARLLDAETITCSFGIAQFSEGDTIDSFIKKADDGLYRAKSRGKNRIEYEKIYQHS